MSLVQNGEFVFPDYVFPAVPAPFPGLPMAPQDKIAKIMSEYEQYVQRAMAGVSQDSKEQVHKLFKWAREAVDFAETQPGIETNVINTAMDIIRTVGNLESSKFKGAALYIMGLWHLFGLFGNRVSNSKSREHFMNAAKLGYSRALYRIGSDYESRGDINTAIVYFEHGVKRGDAACYYRMAMAYLRGHLEKQIDTALGLRYLEKSSLISDPDCPQSAYMYGLIQLGELPYVAATECQVQAGVMALERSAWLGFAPAQIRMGKSWQGGEKGYDAAVALRYFHLASRQIQYAKFKGDDSATPDSETGTAEAEISKWFLCGSDGAFYPNEEWAYKFASLAAEDENPIAEFAVGYFYEVGIYVGVDMKTALEWYKVSSEHGCADAAGRLKELENNDGSVEVGRKLTRKDHERTLTIKGRGSIRSSRPVVESDKDLPAAPSGVLQEEQQAEIVSPSPTETPVQAAGVEQHVPIDAKFDLNEAKLPEVESSPFTVEYSPASPLVSKFDQSTSPQRTSLQGGSPQRASFYQQQQQQQQGEESVTPPKPRQVSTPANAGLRRSSMQPGSNIQQRRASSRPFSVTLSDPPAQVTEKMNNLSVEQLQPPQTSSRSPSPPQHSPPIQQSPAAAAAAQPPQGYGQSPARPESASSTSSWPSSRSASSPSTPTKDSVVTSPEEDKSGGTPAAPGSTALPTPPTAAAAAAAPPPAPPKHMPPPPPSSALSDSSSQQTPNPSTHSNSPASTMTSATSWGGDDLGDVRLGPATKPVVNMRTSSPASGMSGSARPTSSMPAFNQANRSSSSFASFPATSPSPRPNSSFVPPPQSQSPVSDHSSRSQSPSARSVSSSTGGPYSNGSNNPAALSNNYDLKPPAAGSSSSPKPSRMSIAGLGKGLKSPSMMSLNSNRSSSMPQQPKPAPEPQLKPTVPSGQTPMTFEEMGVPKANVKDKDCVIM